MMKELSGIAIHKKTTSQNGEPAENTVAKILAKKSDALGLRIFVSKPIFTVLKAEISLCLWGTPTFCVSTSIARVFRPRYAK